MPLISLRDASVFLDQRPVLHHLNWELEAGAHFAVLGGNGAGKSTFLRLLAGRIWPRPHDARRYDFGEAPTWSPLRAREAVALLSPETQERFARGLQDGPDAQRGWQLDARTAVLSGFFDAELLHQTPSAAQQARADQLIAQLGLHDLAARALQTLSQGQVRRVLLARALVSRPRVLLLDEACSGLDSNARAAMLALIQTIAQTEQTTLGLTTHRASEIVPAIRQILHLENGRWKTPPESAPPHLPAPPPDATLNAVASNAAKSNAAAPDAASLAPLLRLRAVSVFLEGAPVLRDLNWELRRGQHFAVEGGNGAGKTTFLRLLRGELFPAQGGVIERFGEARLRSRAAIGERIALLSPALQARYAADVSIEDAVASGFCDALGVTGAVSPAMRERTRQIMARCGLSELAGRSLARLSYGQRRRVLLARALVNEPQIVLLDEALDGLDARARDEWNLILGEEAARGASLVVVSHHRDDYPPFLTHVLMLENGRLASSRAI